MSINITNITDDERIRANYAEYLVRRKSPVLLCARIGIIIFAVVVVALVIGLLPGAMLPIFLVTAAICWYLWRFTTVEYEYIIISATLELHKILGERSRKQFFEIKTSDIEKVAPLSSYPEIKNGNYTSIIDISDGKKTDEVYFVLYNTDSGKGIIYLNVIKKTLDVFKYYRPSAVEYGSIR